MNQLLQYEKRLKAIFRDFELPLCEGLAMPDIFSDGMIFQAEKPFAVYGVTSPKQAVSVALKKSDGTGSSVSCRADGRGLFVAVLAAQPPSFSEYELIVEALGEVRRIQYVVFGDVFVAAGQSNMQFPLRSANRNGEILRSAQAYKIRFYMAGAGVVGGNDAVFPEKPLLIVRGGYWGSGRDSEAYSNVSAISAALCDRLGELTENGRSRPLGILNIARGGSALHAWIPARHIPPALRSYLEESGYHRHCGITWHGISTMYDTRFAAIAGMQAKAVLWYQGEAEIQLEVSHRVACERLSNGTVGKETYFQVAFGLFSETLKETFGAEIPLIYFALAPHDYGSPHLLFDHWLKAQAAVRGFGAAMTVPLYDIPVEFETDAQGKRLRTIHPAEKLPVGKRAAEMAFRWIYEGGSCCQAGVDFVRRKGNLLQIYLKGGTLEPNRNCVGLSFENESGVAALSARVSSDGILEAELPSGASGRIHYGLRLEDCGNVYEKNGVPLLPFRVDVY